MTSILNKYQDLINDHLLNKVIPFWLRYSLDNDFGGYFNNIDQHGQVYDSTKHTWLQCREVWMWSTLYFNERKKGDYARARQYLAAAKVGAKFITRYALQSNRKRAYFSLSQEGKPKWIQRKMWSECFYVMACVIYGRASNNQILEKEGLRMFDLVLQYAKDASVLGRPSLAGSPNLIALAVPMILLNIIDEIRSGGEGPSCRGVALDLYEDEAQWCLQQLKLHINHDRRLVFENVHPDGTLALDLPEGRVLNPGHAIEGGWFLIQFANRYYSSENRKTLEQLGLNMINWSYEFGWDRQYGGIYYFLDSEGKSPVQLEWNMKLWWPHCEAMVAFLIAYKSTKQLKYLQRFQEVADYTVNTFGNTIKGGWFGYADRRGIITHKNIGAPYKGFFHVPRALMVCSNILEQLCKPKNQRDFYDRNGKDFSKL